MILLKNGTFIDWQTLEFLKTDILVDPGTTGSLQFRLPSPPGRGAGGEGPAPGSVGVGGGGSNPGVGGEGLTLGSGAENPAREPDQVIDCTGKYITRSFANAHHHAYSALSRGMPAPAKNPAGFPEILQYVWWNLDKSLDHEMIWWSGLVTAMECAKRGVTFVIDHHASPNAVKGSLETLAKAFEAVGIGHLLCYEISDRDGSEIAEKGLKETAVYLETHQGLVGLHASCTISDRTLERAVELAMSAASGIHIHVAEDLSDQEHCMKYHQRRVVQRLADAGVLQFPKTILAHCLHLTDRERALVASSPAWVVENMDSNLNNRVGFFNAKGLGPRIMLGTDGMHGDMLQSARSAFFAGHDHEELTYGEPYRRLRNGHRYLQAAGFTGDGENNLVVFGYDPPTPFTKENFPGHFLFGLDSGHITHVIAQGRLIAENGRLLTVDEPAILDEARRQAGRLWERMSR